MLTGEYAILVMGPPYYKDVCFFLYKEAHFYACSLLFSSSLRNPWEYQGHVGFDFLGWTIRQFRVGKTHTGKNPRGKPLGFKTIITPSKEAVKRHVADMKVVIERNRHASQEKLIGELNRVNRGWANYHRRTAASKTFHSCDNVLYLQLRRWAKHRHPHKGGRWMANKYWHVREGKGWQFRSQETTLWKHGQ